MPDEIRYPGVYTFEPPSTPEAKAQSDAVFQDLSAPYVRPTIIRVDAGHDEPEGSDYVEVGRRPDGYGFSGTVMTHDVAGDATGRVFVSDAIGSAGPFGTPADAEAAAIEWAANRGSKTLYVLAPDSVDAGKH